MSRERTHSRSGMWDPPIPQVLHPSAAGNHEQKGIALASPPPLPQGPRSSGHSHTGGFTSRHGTGPNLPQTLLHPLASPPRGQGQAGPGQASGTWALLCLGCRRCGTLLCRGAHADPTQETPGSCIPLSLRWETHPGTTSVGHCCSQGLARALRWRGASLARGESLARGARLAWGTRLCCSTPQTCSAPRLWRLRVPVAVGGRSLLHKLGRLGLQLGCKRGAGFGRPNADPPPRLPPCKTSPSQRSIGTLSAAQGEDGHPWVLHSLRRQLPSRSDESPARNALCSRRCAKAGTAFPSAATAASLPFLPQPMGWAKGGCGTGSHTLPHPQLQPFPQSSTYKTLPLAAPDPSPRWGEGLGMCP